MFVSFGVKEISPEGLKKGLFVSEWTSADEKWTAASVKLDR